MRLPTPTAHPSVNNIWKVFYSNEKTVKNSQIFLHFLHVLLVFFNCYADINMILLPPLSLLAEQTYGWQICLIPKLLAFASFPAPAIVIYYPCLFCSQCKMCCILSFRFLIDELRIAKQVCLSQEHSPAFKDWTQLRHQGVSLFVD